MLQQNNNNNSLCVDTAHRELLQRNGVPLSLGAIPLIKGLRAWALSTAFNSKTKRKAAAEQLRHQTSDQHRGWKPKENLSSCRTPGALVTVATLKGSEGVRQTQTRCLFLREGYSYLCTVGNNKGPGCRARGPRITLNSVEGMRGEAYVSLRGRKTCQDEAGAPEVKPQVVQKWRKSSKIVRSAENSSVTQSKDSKQEQETKRDSQTDAIMQCLKAKNKHSVQQGTLNENNDEIFTHRCEPGISAKASSSASGDSEAYTVKEMPRVSLASTEHKSDLVADVNLNQTNKPQSIHLVSDVATSGELWPEEFKQDSIQRNAEIEQDISHIYKETSIASIVNATRNPPEAKIDHNFCKSENEVVIPKEDANYGHDLAETESAVKPRIDKDSLKSETNQSEVVIDSQKKLKDEDDTMNRSRTDSTLEEPGKVEGGSKVSREKEINKAKNDQARENKDFPESKTRESEVVILPPDVMIQKESPDQGHMLVVALNEAKDNTENDSIKRKYNQHSEVINIDEPYKYADEAMGLSRIKNQKDDPSQGHGLAGTETESKVRMDKDSLISENDQPEVVIVSEEKDGNQDETLALVRTQGPVKHSDQCHDLAGIRTGFKTRRDKDDQSDVVIHSGKNENDKDETLDMFKLSMFKMDTSHGHKFIGVENGSKARTEKDEQPEDSKEMNKFEEDLSDIVTTKSAVKRPDQDHELAETESGSKPGIDEGSVKGENDKLKVVIHYEQTDEGEDDAGGMEESCSSLCLKEVNSGCEEQWCGKSSSRGPPKAFLINPAFNSTTAITTASSRQQQGVGAGFRSLRPELGSQLLLEQEKGLEQDRSKVAGNERLDEGGEEEEDEFGVFMQAGEEQIWTQGFNRLQQVPSGMCDGIGQRNSSNAIEPMSWSSDWTGGLSFHQSNDSWATFNRDDEDVSRGAESEINAGQWWSSTAAENTHVTPLHNLSCVFLEAFPCVDVSCEGDSECVPTLKELLQKPVENHRATKLQSRNLIDGLQDLERMIGVKYKGAESLSRKLLLQSLHLGPASSERIIGRRQATAQFSPNLPSSNQQLAANAKRRLSYDINRNITT
ncbi:titin homolog [Hoplias malabaricus]|uniref:titin homolog n=1 Tax=Hoplias malabaricus TaxID=27720 RepID=UPI0034637EA8